MSGDLWEGTVRVPVWADPGLPPLQCHLFLPPPFKEIAAAAAAVATAAGFDSPNRAMDGHMDMRKLRACMVCGLVQSFDAFLGEGCPNCEPFLALRGSEERVLDSTSSTFSGLIGLVQPAGSWVARWQGIGETKEKGLYAVRVVGRLMDDVQDICEARGIKPAVSQHQ